MRALSPSPLSLSLLSPSRAGAVKPSSRRSPLPPHLFPPFLQDPLSMSSTASMRLSLCAVVALLCWGCFPVGEAHGVVARKSFAEMKQTPRHLAQACRGQLEDTCDGAYQERSDCLAENFAKVTSATCREWLSARAVCADYVIHSDSSPCRNLRADDTVGGHAVRSCIRKAEAELLPAACRQSAYYRSLFAHRPRDGVPVVQ